MWKILVILIVANVCINSSTARLTKRRPWSRHAGTAPSYIGGTSFDYDYSVEPKGAHHSLPATMPMPLQRTNESPTRRPFMNYWRNLMRNVRLSMPTITWNVTNPFANLFNDGEPNFMETQVNQQYDDYTTDVQKRRRKSHRRKQSNRDKRRRTKPASYDSDEPPNIVDATAINGVNGYYDEEGAHMQYMLRPHDTTSNMRTPVLLYDPRTDRYYEIQSVRTQLENTEANQREKPIVTTEPDEFVEIVGTKNDEETSNDVKTLPSEAGSDGGNSMAEDIPKQTITNTVSPPLESNTEAAARDATINAKSRNNDFIVLSNGKSDQPVNWKTILYYFIPQYN